MSTREENAVRIGAAAALRSAWNSLPNQVLSLLWLMYRLFYADRVNISIAAPLIQQYPPDGRPARRLGQRAFASRVGGASR